MGIVDDPNNDNLKVKTFVRTILFSIMWNCHRVAVLKNGAIQVGERGDVNDNSCDRKQSRGTGDSCIAAEPKSRKKFLEKQAKRKIRDGKLTEQWWKKIEHVGMAKYVP